MPDDIRTDRLPASSTEKADGTEPPFTSPPKRTPRVVGPESEVRGGHEAADDSEQLD
jgi:hypothetical protein